MDHQPTSRDREKADRLYKQAVAFAKDELQLHDQPHKLSPSLLTQIRLWRASCKLKAVIEILPAHWPSMWLLGKIYQRLGKNAESFVWFEKACQQNPPNADVPREASLMAMNLGRSEDALRYGEAALKLEPEEPGLIANMALASLMTGQFNEARIYISRSLLLAPNDKVSLRAATLIEHIIEHRAAPPKTHAEMLAYFKRHPELIQK